VVVLIGRGPMGAGMEEIYQITSALRHLSFGKHVAVLTDARFSGVSTGACVGHISPEALAGGPLGKVRDGDLVRIVVDRIALAGSLDLVAPRSGISARGSARILRIELPTQLSADPDLPEATRLWAALRPWRGHWGGWSMTRGIIARLDEASAGRLRRFAPWHLRSPKSCILLPVLEIIFRIDESVRE